MKTKQLIHSLVTFYLINSFTIFAQEIPADSIYFGFTPPGDSAIIFAPGVISLPERKERTPNYLPGYSEFYFTTTVGGARAYSTKYKGKWEGPMIDKSFRTKISDLSISKSGKLASFTSWDGTCNASTNTDIWISERINGEWQEPLCLPAPINSNEQEWGACILDNKTVYVCKRNGSHYDIVKYIYQNGQYSPVYMPEINTTSFEWDPFVPEDESYVIFKSNRSGTHGDMDLYIAYKRADGTYTTPKNLGDKINSAVHDDCGNLTPDGKYFMFARNNRGTGEFDIYWVSSKFIETLRPDNLNP